MSESLNLVSVVKSLWKWKWPIIALCTIAVILSIVLSLKMPNYYGSQVTFFASNPSIADRGQLFKEEAGDIPVSAFGDKEDTDRLISMGKSSQIYGYIINKYNLMEYYEIDKEDKLADFKVNQRFSKNYEIFKNELGAIEVHVADINPEQAATMANDIVAKIDEISSNLLNSNKADVVQLFKSELEIKQKELDIITDKIYKARNSNVAPEILQSYNVSKANIEEDLAKITTLYSQNKAAANKKISSVYILEEAYPAVKKIRPKRSIIVLGALLATFISISLIALVIERLKTIDFKEVDV